MQLSLGAYCHFNQLGFCASSSFTQLELAKHVKDGCKEEGLVGLIFNTIGVSDAITMGTDGTRHTS